MLGLSRLLAKPTGVLAWLKAAMQVLQTLELQQAEETTLQDGERPHIGRSARHASKVILDSQVMP